MEHLSYLSLKILLFQLYWKEEVNNEWNYHEAEKIRLFSQVIVQVETRQLIHKDLYSNQQLYCAPLCTLFPHVPLLRKIDFASIG